MTFLTQILVGFKLREVRNTCGLVVIEVIVVDGEFVIVVVV